MKILYVLDTYYPKVDGPATVINNLASILTKTGLAEVDLLVPKYPKYTDKFDYKVIRCASIFGPDKYRTGLPILNIGLNRKLKNNHYDLIHVHSPFTVGKYAIKFGKKNNIPTINTIHTRYKSDFERKLNSKCLINFMMKYVKKVLDDSSYVMTVSDGFAKELGEIYDYHGKVRVIRNATEFQNIEIEKSEIKALKESLNIKNEFVFLFVGRVVENKNIQMSLDALGELKKSGISSFKFVIVGEGNYKDTLIQKAKDLDLTDNVIFAGLVRDRKLLSTYYSMADLFLFPSTFDTCGIVALEAASFGLPSLMLKGSYASEVITDKKNGFLVDENLQNWCNILSELINDKSKINNIRDYTKKSLNKSWEEITYEYYNFYKKVLFVNKLKNVKTKTLISNKYKNLLIKCKSQREIKKKAYKI